MGQILKKTALALLMMCTITTLAGFSYIRHFADTPLTSRGSTRLITISRGSVLKQISDTLYRNHLIKNSLLFQVFVRLQKKAGVIKAGEYELSAAMSPAHVLDILSRGKVKRHRITLPEGFTVAEVARQLEIAGLGSQADFMALAHDPAFCKSLEIATDNLEGYLFPDTYFFEKNTPEKAILTTMVKRFQAVFIPEWRTRATQRGLSIHQVVTLASIIEKETGTPEERPLISSVFHNRLKRNMRLQSDPTVIYGITDFNGNLTRRDLKTPTPYNTYVIKGLPPGPIANPGRQAMEAALFPADSRFYFFVSKNDTTHHFSATLREHNRAVGKYQRGQ
ncbi:endolytic transglycosylase MltG [Desulfocicer niacini]